MFFDGPSPNFLFPVTRLVPMPPYFNIDASSRRDSSFVNWPSLSKGFVCFSHFLPWTSCSLKVFKILLLPLRSIFPRSRQPVAHYSLLILSMCVIFFRLRQVDEEPPFSLPSDDCRRILFAFFPSVFFLPCLPNRGFFCAEVPYFEPRPFSCVLGPGISAEKISDFPRPFLLRSM